MAVLCRQALKPSTGYAFLHASLKNIIFGPFLIAKTSYLARSNFGVEGLVLTHSGGPVHRDQEKEV